MLWTGYGYDPRDQIVSVTNAKNNVTRAKYDNFGRRTEIDSPDAGRTEFLFDLAGKPLLRLRRRAQPSASPSPTPVAGSQKRSH